MTSCRLLMEELVLSKTTNRRVRHHLQALLFRLRDCPLPLLVVGRKFPTRSISLTGTPWITKCLGLLMGRLWLCFRFVYCFCGPDRREKNKQAARDFRDRQKKTLQDLNTRVRALETERNALTARLLHRESEAKLYEQQIADYRDLLLLYSAKYGIDGVITSPSVQIPPLAPPQQPQQVGFNGTDVQSLQNV